MSQITLRVTEELARGLKDAAARRDMSVNRFATAVLTAATDPDLGETDMDRLRGRLERAGLLDTPSEKGVRPSREQLKEAHSRAGEGRALSDLVTEGRE